jgi:Flp pilus assembly protein TadG
MQISSKQSVRAARLRRFASGQDGSVTVFALLIFIMMLIAAGTAIDFMRQETVRSQVQYNTDRAVLAAASLKQTQDPVSVVADYMAKSQILSPVDINTTSSTGLNFRTVTVNATSYVDTYFLKMLGISSLSIATTSTAEEKIPKVEISLVVDISGSMASYSRLTNLKVAAAEFVTSLLDSTTDDLISISLIPYASYVSVGEPLASQYNIAADHNYSTCAQFADDQFGTTALSQTEPLVRMAHFNHSSSSTLPISHSECPLDSAGNSIVPFSKDKVALIAAINGLDAHGNTAIDVGMRWATALLDPGTQGVVNNMVGAGVIDPVFSGRPLNWTDAEVMKVVVLMTDGSNTIQRNIDPNYRTGLSDVYYDPSLGSTNSYRSYWVQLDSGWWFRRGWYSDSGDDMWSSSQPSGLQRLTYPELWATFSPYWNAKFFYKYIDNSAYYKFRYVIDTVVNGSSADTRLLTNCTAAKDAGLVVFTIGFEAPSAGQAVMQSCASSISHYYDVQGTDISNAFASIAATIQKLKLTQ